MVEHGPTAQGFPPERLASDFPGRLTLSRSHAIGIPPQKKLESSRTEPVPNDSSIQKKPRYQLPESTFCNSNLNSQTTLKSLLSTFTT